MKSSRLLLAAGALAICVSACKDQNAYQAPAPAAVGVQKPVQRTVTLYAYFTGSTAAVNKVDLVARVAGFLEQVGFKDGDLVKEGQTLFSIEKAPYEIALQTARAAQAAQEANLVQTDKNYTRQSALVRSQVTSEANVDVAKAQRDSTAATVDQAKAQVRQAELNLTYATVKAPFDGVMTARLTDPGSYVGASGVTRLATLVQIDPIYVNFSLDERQAQYVRQRLKQDGKALDNISPVPAEVGLQSEQGFPHKGLVNYVAPVLDSSTGTLPVRLVLTNADRLLLPGMFVRVRVPVPARDDGPSLLVPEAAIGSNQLGKYLLTVNDRNIVEQRQVEVGQQTDDGLRVVTSGLKPADRIVVSGLMRAIPGSPVTPTEEKTASANQ